MIILAIETSCDDTCIAVIEIKDSRFKILSNIVSSQVKLHARYGGVYPTLAKREHQRNLIPVLKRALEESNFLKAKGKRQKAKIEIKKLEKILEREEYLFKELNKFLAQYEKPKIDLITVTIGPGLEPCLWTGVNFAKALAYFWHLPTIPVNHIEAHILVNFIDPSLKFKVKSLKLLFPAVCLVVSGGHTQLILMRDFGKYRILGETRDDAAGECFDKVARILGLGYPGGPVIATEAAKLKIKNLKLKINLPRPMINQKNFDFSFSGLKTAVLYDFKNRSLVIRKSPKESQRLPTGQAKEYIQTMAAEVQQAIIDVLIKKTLKATKKYQAKTIILGGGVAANKELRRQFKEHIKKDIPNIQYLIPNIQFCTDNAVMVGVAAHLHYLNPVAKNSCYGVKRKVKNWENIKVNANLRI